MDNIQAYNDSWINEIERLVLNVSFLTDLGLFHGKMGMQSFLLITVVWWIMFLMKILLVNCLKKFMKRSISAYLLIWNMGCAALVGG